jgi:hypothetical protein
MVNVTTNTELSPYFINAQTEQEDCCEEVCSTCLLLDKYADSISQVESKEELEFWILELIDEARKEGYRQALITDISVKADLLEDMECDCEDCCELD